MKTIERSLLLITCMAVCLCASTAFAATRTATTSGSWSNNATWGGNPFPVAGDTANIPSGITVFVSSNRTEACTTLNLNSDSGNDATLYFTNSGCTLNVSGTVTIGTANNGGGGTV